MKKGVTLAMLQQADCVQELEMLVDAALTESAYAPQFWRNVELYGLREAYLHLERAEVAVASKLPSLKRWIDEICMTLLPVIRMERIGGNHGDQKMDAISAEDLFAFAKSVEGKTLKSLYRQAEFKVEVKEDSLIYTPTIRDKTRTILKKHLERHCEEFCKVAALSRITDPYRPKNYPENFYHKSYTLTLILQCLENRERA